MEKLSTEAFKEMLDRGDKFTLINVLDPDDFRNEHIPDSLNIPVSSQQFEEKVEQRIGGKHERVVVYCASSECTASWDAAEKLNEAGFTKVYEYDEGMKGWKESGGKVESGA